MFLIPSTSTELRCAGAAASAVFLLSTHHLPCITYEISLLYISLHYIS